MSPEIVAPSGGTGWRHQGFILAKTLGKFKNEIKFEWMNQLLLQTIQ
jgi:hypothetical protein